eukprot:TRINITY_DN1792_c0_g1_i3.p1 TRINITY_DN1792_c0_g1~~TRINITY_DN1792_c0_g1_i3.p1  ORF type:complete len:863 (-),score=397.97 TRINITY_DN1792_c0_g1_i3:186-2774(-)
MNEPATQPRRGLLCLALALLCLCISMAPQGANAALTMSKDMFLRSRYAELGVSSSGYLASDGPAPPGFHPRDLTKRIGLVYDHFRNNNWNVITGDFVLTYGEARFGLMGHETNAKVENGRLAKTQQIATVMENVESIANRVGKWVGQVDSFGTKLRITREFDGLSAQDSGFFVSVTVDNIGAAATAEPIVFYEALNVLVESESANSNSLSSSSSAASSGTDTTHFFLGFSPQVGLSDQEQQSRKSVSFLLGTIAAGGSTSFKFFVGVGGEIHKIARRGLDDDADGIDAPGDNCEGIYNPDQDNSDDDVYGDACDNCEFVDNVDQDDYDYDGYGDACDNCEFVDNVDQDDYDYDGYGDACDNCEFVDNVDQEDYDYDGVGDACDNCEFDDNYDQKDYDYDGIGDVCDNCEFDDNYDQKDYDYDGIGDVCDNCEFDDNYDQADYDYDGVGDVCDNCVYVFNDDQADYDYDGYGDACDSCGGGNSDGDAYNDECDNCKYVYNNDQADYDNDGFGDVCDNCKYLYNYDQANYDNDAFGDACDNCYNVYNNNQANYDNDAYGDLCDNCINIYNNNQANYDNDAYGDVCDNCPYGANNNQGDYDSDGYGNACDNCPTTYNNNQLNVDGDRYGDVCDNCYNIYNNNQADVDGDSYGDVCDNCPDTYNPSQLDSDNDGAGDVCGCDNDASTPYIECRQSLTAELRGPTWSFTANPNMIISTLIDNCAIASITMTQSVFNLRDTVTLPTPITITARDLGSNSVSCPSSVFPVLSGTLISNSASSLLAVPRGTSYIITWAKTAASFTSADNVKIVLQTLANVPVATVCPNVSYTDGQCSFIFPVSLSKITTYKLKLTLNGVINGGFATIKFL